MKAFQRVIEALSLCHMHGRACLAGQHLTKLQGLQYGHVKPLPVQSRTEVLNGDTFKKLIVLTA